MKPFYRVDGNKVEITSTDYVDFFKEKGIRKYQPSEGMMV